MRVIKFISALLACLLISYFLSLLIMHYNPQLAFNMADAKYLWMRKKIFSPEKHKFDYVVIGSSHLWCAVKPKLIEKSIPGSSALNLGRNWHGRDMDYIMAKYMLERHNIKYIIIETSAPEGNGSHEYAKYFKSLSDLRDEITIRYSIMSGSNAFRISGHTSRAEILKSTMDVIVSVVMSGPAKLFQSLFIDYENKFGHDIKENENTGGFYIADSALTASTKLDPQSEKISDFQKADPNMPLKSTLSDLYLKKLKKIADQHGTKLIFIHLPIPFHDPRLLNDEYFNYYRKMGDVFIPDFNRLHKVVYMADGAHFFGPGADAVTEEIIDLLKNGSQSSKYYSRYPVGMDDDLTGEELASLFQKESLIKNGSFESWPNGPLKSPAFWFGAENISQEKKDAKIGLSCAKIDGDNYNLSQNVSDLKRILGKKVTCFAWIKTSVPDKYRIQIYDGVGASFSAIHNGDGEWHLFHAVHTVNEKAPLVEVRAIQAAKRGNKKDSVYVDGVILIEGEYASLSAYLKKSTN